MAIRLSDSSRVVAHGRGVPFLTSLLPTWRFSFSYVVPPTSAASCLLMAHRACYQEGDLRDYWLRRRGDGLSHRSAVTTTALKLCHVVWRILTDRRDHLPQRPNTKP